MIQGVHWQPACSRLPIALGFVDGVARFWSSVRLLSGRKGTQKIFGADFLRSRIPPIIRSTDVDMNSYFPLVSLFQAV